MHNKKIFLFTIITAFILIFSTSVPIFADAGVSSEDEFFQEELLSEYFLPDNEPIENYVDPNEMMLQASVGLTTVGSFKKTSSTVGTASVRISTLQTVNSISCTIYLQELSGSSYVNSNCSAIKKSGTNISSLSCGGTFKISSSKKYRIKIVAKSVKSGATSTLTSYRSLV